MPSGSLLVDSDSEDIPDIGLSPRVKHNKGSIFGRPWSSRSISPWHCLLVCALSVIFSAQFWFLMRLSKKVDKLNALVAEISLLPTRVDVMEQDLHRLRIEFDLSRADGRDVRTAGTQRNSTRNGVLYVRDVLTKLGNDLQEMKRSFKKLDASSADVSARLSEMEEKCLDVCRLAIPAGHGVREKQRRRQAEKKERSGNEIVFNRVEK